MKSVEEPNEMNRSETKTPTTKRATISAAQVATIDSGHLPMSLLLSIARQSSFGSSSSVL